MKRDRAERIFKRLLKVHREWIKDASEDIKQSGTDRVEDNLRSGGLRAIKILPVGLGQLAVYHGIRGVVEVCDGKETGWKDIDVSVQCHWLAVKLKATAFFQLAAEGRQSEVVSLMLAMPMPGHLLAYSTVLGLSDWQAELRGILDHMAIMPGAVDPDIWKKRAYEPFLMRLDQKLRKDELPAGIEDHKIGPYSGVFTHWDNPKELAESLVTICDYHCDRMIDKGADEEFDVAPFDLYPCEILAVYRIREQLGLETPMIEHPILATPLSAIRSRKRAKIDDPLLARVERFYHEFFGKE